MKKRIILIISALLLIMVIAVPAFAAGTAKITVTPSKTTVYRGDTVSFTVSTSSVANCKSAGIVVSFDTSVFEMVRGKCLIDATMSDFTDNIGSMAFKPEKTVSGNIFQFTLKVKSDAKLASTASVSCTASVRDSAGALTTNVTPGKVTVACKHSYGSWKADGSNHKHTCSICGNVETKAHTYDHGCDTDCNDCGAKRTTSHKFSKEWSADKNGHWHGCTVCGEKTDSAKHTPGEAATEENAQLCTVCDFEIAPALEHIHAPSELWQTDESGHWHTCEKCGSDLEKAEHTFDFACDDSCNDCGYVRPVEHTPGTDWVKDITGHWRVCEVCGAALEKQAHISDEDPAKPKCSECDFELNHEHSFDEQWTTDSESHWHECGCGQKEQAGQHDWDKGVILRQPQGDAYGEMVFTCKTCGYEQKALLVGGGQGGGDTAESDVRMWQIACAALGVALLGSLIFMIAVIAQISRKPKGKYAGR